MPWVAAKGGDEKRRTGLGTTGLELQGPARYRTVNWGEFRLKRFAGDYADQGTEEVQISHYKL